VINSTNIATGKNWRFSQSEMGDWVHGRHYLPRFLIAEAVAASAAVPYVIGALHLRLPRFNWYKTDPATRKRLSPQILENPNVRLWDGGVYENLGLEPVYKPGARAPRHELLIVSDASGELGPPLGNPLSTIIRGHLAAPRLFDIAADQNRALRSRMLVRDIERGNLRGALLRMGNSTEYIHTEAGKLLPTAEYSAYLTEADIEDAFRFPVDLDAIPEAAFDLLVRHGYEVADATLTSYLPDYFQKRQQFPFF
jgi:NTE family protein